MKNINILLICLGYNSFFLCYASFAVKAKDSWALSILNYIYNVNLLGQFMFWMLHVISVNNNLLACIQN